MSLRPCRRRPVAIEPGVFDLGDGLAVFEVQLIRDAELRRLIGAGRRPADVDEPVGVREWQRREEHGVDDAENRRVPQRLGTRTISPSETRCSEDPGAAR